MRLWFRVVPLCLLFVLALGLSWAGIGQAQTQRPLCLSAFGCGSYTNVNLVPPSWDENLNDANNWLDEVVRRRGRPYTPAQNRCMDRCADIYADDATLCGAAFGDDGDATNYRVCLQRAAVTLQRCIDACRGN
jgi:hypothetical protein